MNEIIALMVPFLFAGIFVYVFDVLGDAVFMVLAWLKDYRS